MVLAVLKAGAGYLLLDPAEPQARHHESIATAAITAIIGQDYRLPSADQRNLRYIEVDTALAYGLRSAGPALEVARDAESAACLIVTSGGREGLEVVRLSHRNIANLVYSIAKRPGIGARDVVVSLSPPAADRARYRDVSAVAHRRPAGRCRGTRFGRTARHCWGSCNAAMPPSCTPPLIIGAVCSMPAGWAIPRSKCFAMRPS